MLEAIITIISLIIGIIIGWVIQSKFTNQISKEEFDVLGNQLSEAQRAEVIANTRIEEMESRIEEEKKRIKEVREEMENAFKALASEALKGNSEEFLKIAGEKFKTLSDTTETQLTEKKKLIDQNLGEMSKTLENIRTQSTELKTSLDDSKSQTIRLQNTTEKLQRVLSSSQQRGQWGERMVEDILRIIGMVENKNYRKQQMVESGEKPDFTFLLPKEKTLNMDVKFPLAHYDKFVNAEREEEQITEKKEFLKDVRKHIKTIAGREYINPEQGTLDYVMMFIPNESIYGFINKEDADIIDFALEKGVLLCSPLTLYAVLSLVYQATINFVVENKATEVMKLLAEFKKQWEKYGGLMEKMGKSLETTRNHFDALNTTRTRQLEKPLRKIDDITENMMLEETN
ncbi:MAG: DNA recombination protein RmuC [Candidatus Marinimicrobia bacterium]|nr:DNA recombination protein RmuC [Candidatus Neomarinimicrobiota bacterium]MBL7022838.1 DNA recombination protein RmuC [Candidatus Neomarinimicrobiota bacterium]MBL7109441.1 DNA recombination protein RmuC [Candidatus Neomarinimicrobiota bacterium]